MRRTKNPIRNPVSFSTRTRVGSLKGCDALLVLLVTLRLPIKRGTACMQKDSPTARVPAEGGGIGGLFWSAVMKRANQTKLAKKCKRQQNSLINCRRRTWNLDFESNRKMLPERWRRLRRGRQSRLRSVATQLPSSAAQRLHASERVESAHITAAWGRLGLYWWAKQRDRERQNESDRKRANSLEQRLLCPWSFFYAHKSRDTYTHTQSNIIAVFIGIVNGCVRASVCMCMREWV